MYARETITELNALSKEVFGASSRWRKLIDKGIPELVTETKEELVPGDEGEEPTTQEVKVPVLRADGARQFRTKRYDVGSVREHMLEVKAQQEELREMIRKMQEEQAAKKAQAELEAKLHSELSGSALV